MDIDKSLKYAKHFFTNNSPSILTGLAVAGVITTAVLAIRATPKALEQIAQERDFRGGEGPVRDDDLYFELSTMDIVKVTWKGYIPTVAFGTMTIACVVGANSISSKKTAAVVSAYSIAETALKEYQSKVVETLGAHGDQKVRDLVAKDHLDKNPSGKAEIYITGMGEQLCYESLSGRYFKSDIETIRKAQNDINAEVFSNMYASHNEFYRSIGLEGNTYGEEAGWNTEHTMELVFSTHLSEDGRPCLSIGYRNHPILNYHRVH